MDAQQIPAVEPQIERIPRQPSQIKTDSLVDAALDALSETPPSNDNAQKPREPSVQKRRPEQEAESAPDPDESEEEPLAAQDESAVEGEQEDGDPDKAHDLRGSKEQPFTVKDLPGDKFIEVKVDGEKTVVPLSELAAGYVREQTFHQRINKTRALAEEAQAAVEKATEFPKRLAQEFRTFVGDPEQLYEFFMQSEEREQVLEQVARRFAELRMKHRENPEERLKWLRQRDSERLRQEREAFEQQRAQEEAERTRKAEAERAMSIFKPGWEAGLRRAGFPQPTKELWEEVQVRCNQRVQSGNPVTSADVEEFVVRACRLLELKPASAQKPKAAPPAPKKPETRRASGDEWSKVPAHKRRNSADYFLSSLKPRDFR